MVVVVAADLGAELNPWQPIKGKKLRMANPEITVQTAFAARFGGRWVFIIDP